MASDINVATASISYFDTRTPNQFWCAILGGRDVTGKSDVVLDLDASI